jgi:hypothetical protein
MYLYKWTGQRNYTTSAAACQQFGFVLAQLTTDSLFSIALTFAGQIRKSQNIIKN